MIRPDATVACHGFNSHGQLGDGTFDYHTTPVAVTGLSDVAQLSAGYEQTCPRRHDNSLWCWGSNDAGQIGDGSMAGEVIRPTAVDL
jgi:alpha-tubulin suppressor-like RCC1 family protein